MTPILPLLSLLQLGAAPLPPSDPPPGRQAFEWTDYDGDGQLDVLALDGAGVARLLRNEGGGRFDDATVRVGLAEVGDLRSASWRDVDLDGRPDLLLVTRAGGLRLLVGEAGAVFVERTTPAGLDGLAAVRETSWIDVDVDGDPDLFVLRAGSAELLRNEQGRFLPPEGVLAGTASASSRPGAEADPRSSLEVDGPPTDLWTPPGAVSIAPEPEEPPPAGTGDGRGPQPVLGSRGTIVKTDPEGPRTQSGNAALFCADSLEDVVSGACLTASTVATLGSLYPISNELFVDGATGFVGVNTTTPQYRFQVEGQLVAGLASTASGAAAVISGGADNFALGDHSTVAGGQGNEVANAWSTVSGGQDNISFTQWTVIGGGLDNLVSGDAATVGGGTGNEATALAATVAGGMSNSAVGQRSSILGGELNLASGAHATVAGGRNNMALGDFSALGGGADNETGGIAPTVAGGLNNTATANSSTVGGGFSNVASGTTATVVGGESNTASGARSAVLGGFQNRAQGSNATVVGGFQNEAQGAGSLAAGSLAKALHAGSFVWADDQALGFSTTAIQQFLVRAAGGVGITNVGASLRPEAPLHVFAGSAGTVTANVNSIAVFEHDTGGFVSLLGPDGASKGFLFGNATDPNSGGIVYDQATVSAESMQFRTGGNSTRMTILANGNVGIGTSSPSARFEVAGIAKATSFVQTSDARLKREVREIEGAMKVLRALDGVSYEWDLEALPEAPAGRHLGLLAQQVREVLPEAVVEAADGSLAVEYSALVPVLIEALEDKDVELAELHVQLAELCRRVELLERSR